MAGGADAAQAALLIAALLLASVAGQSDTPGSSPPRNDPASVATSIFDREKCGRLGQPCCNVMVEANIYVETCEDALYCLDFPSPDTGDSSSATTQSVSSGDLGLGGPGGTAQSSSLCLPLPAKCGHAGGVCCPLTGNRTNGSQRCTDANTLCLSATGSDTIFGDLTHELYLQLQQDPNMHIDDHIALSVWGTCQSFDPALCGQAGGLCGDALPPPAPACPASAAHCPDGYYCQDQEGQVERFALCTAIPPGCGVLSAPCCPFGNYSQGAFDTPFCWDADVYCAARADDVENATCLRLPRSPQECGAPDGPCCPSPAGIISDKPLPAVCQDGAYCDYPSGATGGDATPAGGTCVANDPNCGRIAKPCCAVNGRSGLLYTCNDGLYCPEPGEQVPVGGSDGASSGGVLLSAVGLADRVCQECTPLVPAKYQAACGFGVGASPSPDYYCNSADYYCGDYAPAPAPGPYSDYMQPGGFGDPPAEAPVPEEQPPLGPTI